MGPDAATTVTGQPRGDVTNDKPRHNRHEQPRDVLGEGSGRQVATTGELVRLPSRLAPNLPLEIDPVLREVGANPADNPTTIVVAATHAHRPQGLAPAVECFGLAAPPGAFPTVVPRKVKLPGSTLSRTGQETSLAPW